MAHFTFYRGIWGSCQPAVPVPANEDDSLIAAAAGPGHTVHLSGRSSSIFTHVPDIAVNPTYETLDIDAECGISLNTSYPSMRKRIDDYMRIADIAREYHGLPYIIYVRDVNGAIWRAFFGGGAHLVMLNRLISHIHAFYINTASVIYCNPSQANMEERRLSQIDLCYRCGYYSVTLLHDEPYIPTVIIVEKDGCNIQKMLSRNTSGKKRTITRKTLQRFVNSIGYSGVYICTFSADGIAPRVYEPHIRMMENILLTRQQIDTYMLAETPPADDDTLTYDD